MIPPQVELDLVEARRNTTGRAAAKAARFFDELARFLSRFYGQSFPPHTRTKLRRPVRTGLNEIPNPKA